MNRAGHELPQGRVHELVLFDPALPLKPSGNHRRLVVILGSRQIGHDEVCDPFDSIADALFNNLGFNHKPCL